MRIQPYLSFDGRCEEAVQFYKQALGAEVLMLMRFNESPEAPPPGTLSPGSENKIMHASLRIGESLLMASDGRCTGKPNFTGITLSLGVKTEDEAQRRFTALSEGGNVHMPLGKTFFAPLFGMVADQFGVSWMVLVQSEGAG